MRWQGGRESDEVEDRRGMQAPRGGVAIGGGGLLLLLAISYFTGANPLDLLQAVTDQQQVSVEPGETGRRGAPADEEVRFASVVLASTEDVWEQQLARRGVTYRRPTLVL